MVIIIIIKLSYHSLLLHIHVIIIKYYHYTFIKICFIPKGPLESFPKDVVQPNHGRLLERNSSIFYQNTSSLEVRASQSAARESAVMVFRVVPPPLFFFEIWRFLQKTHLLNSLIVVFLENYCQENSPLEAEGAFLKVFQAYHLQYRRYMI